MKLLEDHGLCVDDIEDIISDSIPGTIILSVVEYDFRPPRLSIT